MTLSKEELQQIAADGFIKHGDAKTMARELLDRRERDKQEPVAWRNKETGRCGSVAIQGKSPSECGYEPLYLAPPSPLAAAEPVRYMNRYTGACYTLAQQPDAAKDTAVYVPLYAETPAPVVQVPEWTNEQCIEFLCTAFRHAEIKGDIEMDDIRLGVKMADAMLKQPSSIQACNSACSGEEIKQPASNEGQS